MLVVLMRGKKALRFVFLHHTHTLTHSRQNREFSVTLSLKKYIRKSQLHGAPANFLPPCCRRADCPNDSLPYS